ncbi:uncharacterized protein LY89DRAFT_651401 [Mollisia scopiformis]|uniref:CENP-V/GFA domain-containing protein n=1 Tax=Mollisia scopiformis TaxID=149040 RepID=A0A194WZA4_MOLSC|nr:uncharacterized protein LY89DRAFT_651401 [Mollisia scopiformis]KUJ13280.1 hypothetical protein LY89DRAFT_651401 [Mollisia scopiformis]
MAHGSCICGDVKYSFTGEPISQAICHCIPCRKVSGGAFTTNILVQSTSFTLLSGAEKLKTYALKHPAGMTLTYHFCETCGTKIYKEGDADAFKGVFIVQAGTLDSAEGEKEMGLKDVKIGAELWVKERVGWLGEQPGAVQCQEFS